MKSTRAAGRYSKALIELALERNALEQIKTDALVVLNAIENSKELRNLLASPIIKPAQKHGLLSQIFGEHVSELTMLFIALIVKQGRDQVLEQIFGAVINDYREHMNILEATFTTSTTVPASTLAAIKQKLEHATGKTIEINATVDSRLIGGYIVDMKNYRLDASLAGGMKKLKRELSK
jgi:F-type H+-transporting ATPase subunit delta